ncbi:pseudouridine-5'-phosphatase isoform X1 [Halyomorpha halys]|uniref:pseudouridine-5'-phosphatase isoform X1 n=1 Tax=Halyomorpha halys TaxID=286706 RepID=UPI0006D50B6C|nr:pseudouridine-5'-phosphatase-like isoform X2 [Halyomorpha halys]
MFSAGLGLCTRTKLFYFFRNSSFRPVTHVIFDLDGTILDSETLYELIYNKILKKYGKKFNQEVRTAITGTNEQETSRKMVEMLELPITPAQYWSEIEALCKVHLTNPGIKPGAERLISHLSKEKVPLAIATSGSIKGFEIKSQGRPDLFAHFHHIVHGSSDLEVVHGKPAPDIFLVTAKRFPADPTKLNKPRMSELSLAYRKVTTKITAQNPATHVIFDLDGTLLDTEKAYKETFKQMGREYGVTYDDQLHKEVTGMKTIERCRYIVQKFGLHVSPEEWYQSVKERRLQMFSNSKLKPGAEKLITHLHASKVPMAVASGTGKLSYEIKTKPHSRLFKLLHHVVHASSDPEVPVGKPDPRIFLVCAKRFKKKPDPKECLVFEDSLNGLQAGKAAGMQVVFIPENDYTEDQAKSAVIIIKSLQDFKPEDFSLPPYP